MAEYDFEKMQKKLQKYLDEDRFNIHWVSCIPARPWQWLMAMI